MPSCCCIDDADMVVSLGDMGFADLDTPQKVIAKLAVASSLKRIAQHSGKNAPATPKDDLITSSSSDGEDTAAAPTNGTNGTNRMTRGDVSAASKKLGFGTTKRKRGSK